MDWRGREKRNRRRTRLLLVFQCVWDPLAKARVSHSGTYTIASKQWKQSQKSKPDFSNYKAVNSPVYHFWWFTTNDGCHIIFVMSSEFTFILPCRNAIRNFNTKRNKYSRIHPVLLFKSCSIIWVFL
jgi:hypothetical protein